MRHSARHELPHARPHCEEDAPQSARHRRGRSCGAVVAQRKIVLCAENTTKQQSCCRLVGPVGSFFFFLPHAKPELITKLTDSTRRVGCPRGKTSCSPAPNSFPRAQGLNGTSLVTIKRWKKIKESAPSSRRRVCFPFPQGEGGHATRKVIIICVHYTVARQRHRRNSITTVRSSEALQIIHSHTHTHT